MLASFKSELRKIWSVRSTYVVLIIAVVILGFFAFYSEGLRAGLDSSSGQNPYKVANLISAAIANLGMFGALVGILSFTHEYRYNTIMYTLTGSKSRTRSLFAKVAAISVFAVFFTVFVSIVAVGAMSLGLTLKGAVLVPQTLDWSLVWHVLLAGWGFSMFGLIIAGCIRHQAGAIAAFFLTPVLVEQLASLLLKNNSGYLPFAALSEVASPVGMTRSDFTLSPGKAAIVVVLYVVAGWVISWFLFLKRDAN